MTTSISTREDILSYLTNQGDFKGNVIAQTDKCMELLERMHSDIARFTFLKKDKDGSLIERVAYGTLQNDVFSAYDQVPEGKSPGFTGAIRYFDTERQQWRSFNVGRLLRYDRDWDFEKEIS